LLLIPIFFILKETPTWLKNKSDFIAEENAKKAGVENKKNRL